MQNQAFNINGKEYKLTKRGQFFKTAIENIWAGIVGIIITYMITMHWFG